MRNGAGVCGHKVTVNSYRCWLSGHRYWRNRKIATTGLAFVAFVVTTLVSEPASMVTLLVIVLLAVGLDVGWKYQRDRTGPGPVRQ